MSLDPDEEMECDEMCEVAGHEWLDAGAGLLVCAYCGAEKWADDDE